MKILSRPFITTGCLHSSKHLLNVSVHLTVVSKEKNEIGVAHRCMER